jgi:predicted dehydrogenase
LTKDSPIRIAIVGVGKIARDQHIPVLRRSGDFELVATVDRKGPFEDLPNFADVPSLLAAGVVDAISLCTPPEGRSELARPAIDAGVHVMLEKPPAVVPAEAEALKAAAAKAGVCLFATWHSREAHSVDAARDWLKGKQLKAASILWREDIRKWHPGQDWILSENGFGVFDPGINALSIATSILPAPLELKHTALQIPSNRQSPIVADLEMICGGAPVEARFDFLKTGDQQWDIVVDTDAGQMRLHEGGRVFEADGKVVQGPDEEYARLYARFAQLVRAREIDVDLAPLQLAAEALRIGERSEAAPFEW